MQNRSRRPAARARAAETFAHAREARANVGDRRSVSIEIASAATASGVNAS